MPGEAAPIARTPATALIPTAAQIYASNMFNFVTISMLVLVFTAVTPVTASVIVTVLASSCAQFWSDGGLDATD